MQEAPADSTQIRRELSASEPTGFPRAEYDVHPFGLEPLDGGDLLAVVRELQNMGGPRVARELGVVNLVAPVAERGWSIYSNEEVRAAAPATRDEYALVDHLRAGNHCRLRGVSGGIPVDMRAWIWDFDHNLALAAELGEVEMLVDLTLGGEEIRLGTAALLERTTVCHFQIKVREICALEEMIEIAGRENDRDTEFLHAVAISAALSAYAAHAHTRSIAMVVDRHRRARVPER
jgi:hypothetical protein